MKKIFLILFIFALLFLTACTQQQISQDQQTNQQMQEEEQTQTSDQQQTTTTSPPTLKEFTIEADDIGLYPDTITVNKGDNAKITFKVRTDKVYYGGLDFRSSIWGDTGKVLPGGMTTVEFVAQETFTYTSYWPSSNRLKATGTVNVIGV